MGSSGFLGPGVTGFYWVFFFNGDLRRPQIKTLKRDAEAVPAGGHSFLGHGCHGCRRCLGCSREEGIGGRGNPLFQDSKRPWKVPHCFFLPIFFFTRKFRRFTEFYRFFFQIVFRTTHPVPRTRNGFNGDSSIPSTFYLVLSSFT